MDVVRLLVGVINVNNIPELVNIVVGYGLYEISLKSIRYAKTGPETDFYPTSSDKKEGDDESKDKDFDGFDDLSR